MTCPQASGSASATCAMGSITPALLTRTSSRPNASIQFCDGLVHLPVARDVAGDRHGLLLADLAGDFRDGVGAPGDERDLGPGRREALGRRFADAAAGAGDHHHLAGHVHGGALLLV